MTTPTVVVLGDSLSFHGPERAHPADEPRLWPHVAGAAAGATVELHAGLGWTARHAWRAIVGDPRLWVSLRRADALVLGVGGMDTLPSPVPTAIRELIPALRPAFVRHAARRLHASVVPPASVVLDALAGGRPVALPPEETVRHLERCRVAVTTLRPAVPVVVLLPSVHRSPFYGGVHRGRERHVRALRSWARAHDVLPVDPAPLVAAHVLGGHGNPDGIHWGWDAHARVGAEVGRVLATALAR